MRIEKRHHPPGLSLRLVPSPQGDNTIKKLSVELRSPGFLSFCSPILRKKEQVTVILQLLFLVFLDLGKSTFGL